MEQKIITKFTSNVAITEIRDEPRNETVGELSILDNHLKFRAEDDFLLRPPILTAHKDMQGYKVYTLGGVGSDTEYYLYYVSKVVVGRVDLLTDDKHSSEINGITKVSFSIRGFNSWLKQKSIGLSWEDEKEERYLVKQEKIEPIVIYDDDKMCVIIVYKPNYVPATMDIYGTQATIGNDPKILMLFKEKVSDIEVLSKIDTTVRFFSLCIGEVSYVEDIRFYIEEIDKWYTLYLNRDFSHNYNRRDYSFANRARLAYCDIKEIIIDMYGYWIEITSNPDMVFLLDMYFGMFSKRQMSIEDKFLTCCKFIEGYDLREEEHEKIAKELENAIIEKLKGQAAKDVLAPIFSDLQITFKPRQVAEWIARGHLNKVSLNTRINKYDNSFFGLISGCQDYVFGKGYAGASLVDRIVLTRNYYSHMKNDKTGILSLKEMLEATSILSALITAILLQKIGFKVELIEEVMRADAMYGLYVRQSQTTKA